MKALSSYGMGSQDRGQRSIRWERILVICFKNHIFTFLIIVSFICFIITNSKSLLSILYTYVIPNNAFWSISSNFCFVDCIKWFSKSCNFSKCIHEKFVNYFASLVCIACSPSHHSNKLVSGFFWGFFVCIACSPSHHSNKMVSRFFWGFFCLFVFALFILRSVFCLRILCLPSISRSMRRGVGVSILIWWILNSWLRVLMMQKVLYESLPFFHPFPPSFLLVSEMQVFTETHKQSFVITWLFQKIT